VHVRSRRGARTGWTAAQFTPRRTNDFGDLRDLFFCLLGPIDVRAKPEQAEKADAEWKQPRKGTGRNGK